MATWPQGMSDCPNSPAIEQQSREKSPQQKQLSVYFCMRETALQLEIQVLTLLAYFNGVYLF